MSEAGETEKLDWHLARLRAGDDEAAAELWNRYFERLVRLAQRKLPNSLRRSRDEEDVALSAFHSFVAGIREDRFPDLSGSDNLWGLLIVLTSRKASAHLRHQRRQKRGGGRVRGESAFLDPHLPDEGPGVDNVGDEHASPELAAELAEAAEVLLERLDDDQLRRIAVQRMEGYRVDEIASDLKISKRAVERRLHLIRKLWTEAAENHSS